MKRILSLGLIFIFALALALSLGTGSVVLAEGEEDPVFTVTLEPTGTDANENGIIDAEVGGTVLMDVYLSYSGETDVSVNAFGFRISVPTGLSFDSVTWDISGGTGVKLLDSNRLNLFFDTYGDDSALINFSTGTKVKLGTLKFNVANTGLIYGQVLEVAVNTASNYTSIGISTDVYEYTPDAVNGQVEIMTEYTFTWSGLTGDDETTSVGVGLVPTHDDPIKPGYTFTGWENSEGTVYQQGTALPPATADDTYTAQWSPTAYNVTFAEGTSFGDTQPPTTYTIESGIAAVPVLGGCTFQGWTAEPITPGDTDYNWDTATTPILPANTVGLYGNVKLTPVWTVAADVVFAEYAYAGNGSLLMLVGVNGVEEGKAVKYAGNAMFFTDDQHYCDLLNAADGTFSRRLVNSNGKSATHYERVYLFIVPASTTFAEANAALTIDSDNNTEILRNGDVNLNTSINSGDWSVVDSLLSGGAPGGITMQMRLEADVCTSPYDYYRFGNIDDIATIIDIANSLD